MGPSLSPRTKLRLRPSASAVCSRFPVNERSPVPPGGPLQASAFSCPSYNGEPYLVEAIDSVLGQSYADLELLTLNDGATDGPGKNILVTGSTPCRR